MRHPYVPRPKLSALRAIFFAGIPFAHSGAGAQTKSAATGSDIVVTGQAPVTQSSIDRKSYAVTKDLQSAAGTASDVLRNIPSVDVDAQGAISLRGDANVQILIDGKPSTTMTNANRADALEQLPANTIDHIEVITNPSARFKADGSGGIINIVTKKDGKLGLTGSANTSTGTDGRFNFAVNSSYRTERLRASASATLHRDMRWRPLTDRRSEIDPTTGLATRSEQDSLFHGHKLSRIVTGSFDYDITKQDRLIAGGTYNHRTGTPQLDQHNRTIAPNGLVTSDFTRGGTGYENEVTDEATFKFRHNFQTKGQQFTFDLRRGETIENEVRRFTSTYQIPAGLIESDRQRPRSDTLQRQATAEYAQPLWGGKLLAGYDLQRNYNDFLNHGEIVDPASGAASIDPGHTYHFVYGQTVHAFYGTYDHTLATNLSAIFGLRLEQTEISTDERDTAMRGSQSYFRAYPTLHLEYALADKKSLKFSYSKRIVRPDPEDLNPFPVFSDPLNLRAGNPGLKPQTTQALEAAYKRDGGVALEATLFARFTRNQFTEVSHFITPTTLLTTKENLGKSSAIGLDIAASGKLASAINYRLSGTLSRNAIDAADLGFLGSRSLVAASAKAALDFKISAADLLQLSGVLNAKRLTPQGFRLPSASGNLGFRHKFKNGLVAVATLTDIFNTQRDRIRLDTATIIDRSERRNIRRVASLSLTMPLTGTRTAVDAPIEYSN